MPTANWTASVAPAASDHGHDGPLPRTPPSAARGPGSRGGRGRPARHQAAAETHEQQALRREQLRPAERVDGESTSAASTTPAAASTSEPSTHVPAVGSRMADAPSPPIRARTSAASTNTRSPVTGGAAYRRAGRRPSPRRTARSGRHHAAMLAAIHDRTGPAHDVLRVEEVETPEPGPGEVRVRVAVSGVNPTDWKSRAAQPGELDAAVPGPEPGRRGHDRRRRRGRRPGPRRRARVGVLRGLAAALGHGGAVHRAARGPRRAAARTTPRTTSGRASASRP